MEMVKIKYVGTYEIKFFCPMFLGLVKPEQIIEIPETVYATELINNPDWILLTDKPTKKNKGDK